MTLPFADEGQRYSNGRIPKSSNLLKEIHKKIKNISFVIHNARTNLILSRNAIFMVLKSPNLSTVLLE